MRHLSATTIAVATASPPRKGEFLEVRLAVDDVETYLWSEVLAVTLPDANAPLGAAGFSARFVSPGARAEQELQRIVDRVGTSGVVADPTPTRSNDRYPIRWPIDIGWSTGSSRYTALDVSRGGLFVASHSPLPVSTRVAISIPDDVGEDSMRGDGRVARVLDGELASAKDMHPGFGIELSMRGIDSRNFERLVNRVSQRNRYHVVVAASAQRLALIVDELSAVGYATSGAERLDALIDKAFARSHGPDAVLVDQSFEQAYPETIQSLTNAVKLRPTRLIHADCGFVGAARANADRSFAVEG